MGLTQAIQNCQRFVGKNGIRGIGGTDRVMVFCDSIPSAKIQNAVTDAAAPHAVVFWDGPA